MVIEFNPTDLESYSRDFETMIGRGFSGRIFVGTIPQYNPYGLPPQAVAIKMISYRLDEIHKTTWEVEKAILSVVDHPNVIRLIGYSQSKPNKALYLVLEYMPKGNLRANLPELDWGSTLRVAIGIAKGLEYLHGLPGNIVHRDLKSDNVLLTDDFEAKICDFGVAQMDMLRYVRVPLMGPNQSQGDEDKIKASDIHNYGCILHELMSKECIYDSPRAHRVNVHKSLNEQGCSTTAARKILKLQEKCISTRNRRPTATEIIRVLQEVQAGRKVANVDDGTVHSRLKYFLMRTKLLPFFGFQSFYRYFHL